MLNAANERHFFLNASRRLAQCLAALKPTPEEKFNKLWRLCPQKGGNGILLLDSRARDAVVALGIYYVESGYQFSERIFPYILNISCGLIPINWKINDVEGFIFAIHTLLSDVVAHSDSGTDNIRACVIYHQVKMLNGFAEMNSIDLSFHYKKLLGLIRAIGRCSSKGPFFTNALSNETVEDYSSTNHTCVNFPNTSTSSESTCNSGSCGSTFSSVDSNFDSRLPDEKEPPPDTDFIFCGLKQEIATVLQSTCMILEKNLAEPNFSNIDRFRLATVAMLRRLLCDEIKCSDECISMIRGIADRMYAENLYLPGVYSKRNTPTSSRTCGGCLVLLEWAATEECEADRLLDRMQSLLDSHFTNEITIAFAPVLVHSFQCIANIALKFQELLDKCVFLLRNFLVSPTPAICASSNSPALKNVIAAAAFSLSQVMRLHPDICSKIVMNMSSKSLVESVVIGENVIVTLGTLAVEFAPSSITVRIISIFQQYLYSSATFLSPLIMDKMGAIAVSRIAFSTYNEIVTLITELPKPGSWRQFLKVLTRLAGLVAGFARRQVLLNKLLELFTKLILRDQSPVRAIELISVIEVLAQRVPRVSMPDARLRQLFLDFWLCCVAFGLHDDARLPNIAIKSPCILSYENLTHIPILQRDAFKHIIPSRYENLIFRHSAFLLTVEFLMNLRIKGANAEFSSFIMYSYLESPYIYKSGLLTHMFRITENALSQVITILMSSGRHEALETYAMFLLVKSAYPLMSIRQESVGYLHALSKAFPPILWRRSVIWNMLDILQIFSSSLNNDWDSSLARLGSRIPLTWLKLDIYRYVNFKAREEAVTDFNKMCSGFLDEATMKVPDIIQSHIQEYISVRPGPSDSLKCHAGIVLFLQKFLKTNQSSTFWANFLDALTLRCKHTGEIHGVLKQGPEALANLKRQLLDGNDTCNLFQLTAMIIALPKPDRALMHKLCTSPMSAECLQAMDCWNWLMSARPDLKETFLCHMSSAWQETSIRSLGLFSESQSVFDEKFKTFPVYLLQTRGDLLLHKGWVYFLTERIRYASQRELEIFTDLLHQSLPITVQVKSRLCRHVDVAGIRFALLSNALAIVSNCDISSASVIILRERIYASTLDYFTGPPTYPSKENYTIGTTIDIMITFWQDLHADKRKLERQGSISTAGKLKENDVKLERYIYFSNLILSLLAVEIAMLVAWNSPHPLKHAKHGGEKEITQWRSLGFIKGRELINLAWKVCPALAVWIPKRIEKANLLTPSLSTLVLNDPMAVCDIPDALPYLATIDSIVDDHRSLPYVLTWCHVSPFRALAFFSRQLPFHPLTSQYAVRTLSCFDNEMLCFCTPQIVQALRHDALGYVQEFILKISKRSHLVAHHLIWNLRSLDSPVGVKAIFQQVTRDIVAGFSHSARAFYENEFRFFDDITSIAHVLRGYPKEERQEVCRNNLQALQFRKGCYLPYKPEWIILGLDYKTARTLQSAAKAPFQVNFQVQHCPSSKIELHAPNLQPTGPLSMELVIFKEGDDVRQDVLALQIIDFFHAVFRKDHLDLYLRPYRVVSTSPGCGIVECVPHTKSRDQMGRETGVGLYDYFEGIYGHEDSPSFNKARENFTSSLAAYSVVMYLLQVKDRHNGNILLDAEGHIIHIDFGFLFESSPGGNLGFEPDLKITGEMLRVMGVKSFYKFLSLCVKAYLAIRPFHGDVITAVSLMLDTRLPCFRGHIIDQLRERFRPTLNDRDAAKHILGVIKSSIRNARSWVYDVIQYNQNQISY